MEIKALTGQNLLDVAIQVAGSAEAVFEIARLNGISATDPLTAGQVIQYNTIVDDKVADYYRIRNITPATDIGEQNPDETASAFGRLKKIL